MIDCFMIYARQVDVNNKQLLLAALPLPQGSTPHLKSALVMRVCPCNVRLGQTVLAMRAAQ